MRIHKKTVSFPIQAFLPAVLFLTACASSPRAAKEAKVFRGTASAGLNPVPFQFDPEKVRNAKNSFHFMRAFADYYYLLLSRNTQNFQALSQLQRFSGWCVGDAHAENFGALLQATGRSYFTVNDMDDAGPCPLADDFFRFLASSKLADDDFKTGEMLDSYLDGLQGNKVKVPEAVSDLLKKSEKRGMILDSDEVKNSKFVHAKDMQEISAATQKQIITGLQNLFPGIQLYDLIQTAKEGGGSGGQIRYEVLASHNSRLVQLELKEQVPPAIAPVAPSSIPKLSERIQKTLKYEQGDNPSPYYRTIQIGSLEMLIRPKFHGDVGAELGSVSKSDQKDLVYFEAYILGFIHRQSAADLNAYVQALKNLPKSAWKNDVELMIEHMDQKFRDLK